MNHGVQIKFWTKKERVIRAITQQIIVPFWWYYNYNLAFKMNLSFSLKSSEKNCLVFFGVVHPIFNGLGIYFSSYYRVYARQGVSMCQKSKSACRPKLNPLFRSQMIHQLKKISIFCTFRGAPSPPKFIQYRMQWPFLKKIYSLKNHT